MKKKDYYSELEKAVKERVVSEKVNKKVNIFISYNNKDVDVVREIALKLSLEGWTIYFDEWRIRPGESISESINLGLTKTNFFLLVWSKNSSKSKWVTREWSSLMSKVVNKKVTIIPIKIDDTPLPQILSDTKYLILSNDVTDYYKLFQAITGHWPEHSFSQTVILLLEEIILDAIAVKQFNPRYGPKPPLIAIIGNKRFWTWETKLREGRHKCKHDFKKVEWNKKLGSNYGEQSKYFYIYRQLLECHCGAQFVLNQILDRK